MANKKKRTFRDAMRMAFSGSNPLGAGGVFSMPTGTKKKPKNTGTSISDKQKQTQTGGLSKAPKKSVRPKSAPRASQKLSAREAAELKQSGVKYEGIPEGSVPATAMPKGNMMLSARERAEMGMKKGRKVKKKGMNKGGRVRGTGIARKGVRPAKMV